MPVPTCRLLWLRVPEFPGLQTFLGWGDFSAKTRKDQEKARQVGHLVIDTVPEVLRGWMISQPCHLVVKLFLSFHSFTVYSLERGMTLSGIMAPLAESYSGTRNSPKSYVIASLESDPGSKTMWTQKSQGLLEIDFSLKEWIISLISPVLYKWGYPHLYPTCKVGYNTISHYIKL